MPDLLEQILAEEPRFHRGETEIKRRFDIRESYLNAQFATELTKDKAPYSYGIPAKVARFLYDSIGQGAKTLETGAGTSTLVFALRSAEHTSVTPDENEASAIKEYAAGKGLSMDTVSFVTEESEKYLPRCDRRELDLVFIDGKHAFPWPVIDWFYTADLLKKGGLMVLDDVQYASVSILRDFMNDDPRWKLHRSFDTRVVAFEKISDSVHDVAWHMQPFILKRMGGGQKESFFFRLRRYLLRRMASR